MSNFPDDFILSSSDAFAQLQADREQPWLAQVFVPPANFATIVAGRSVLVLGSSGAGKTAVRMQLEHLAQTADSGANRLVAHWQLALQDDAVTGSQLVQACLAQIFAACASALLRHLAEQPDAYTGAPNWVRDTVRWYLQTYFSGSWSRQVDRLSERVDGAGAEMLRSLFTVEAPVVLNPDAPSEQVIAELGEAIKRLRLRGVWVLVDGLEPWVLADAARVGATLRTLFATLVLFQSPDFDFKLMAPVELGATIADASGLVRHRLEPLSLEWSTSALLQIIERRLAAITGNDVFTLADLGDRAVLCDWFERYAGATPRGWLRNARPVVEAYFMRATRDSLTAAECTALLRSQPPMLRIDRMTGSVFVGENEIADLQPTTLKLLRYLYDNRPRLCPRSELYFRGYVGLDHEPRSAADPGWEGPALYAGALDTALYRLRQALEPDPSHPIYLITQRDKGVQLRNTW